MPKNAQNYCTIALISHASNIMLKILQARFQQCMNWELPDVQAGFRKGKETRDQIANIHWIIEKARAFQKKNTTSASLTLLTCCVDHNQLWKILKRWEYQTTLLDSLETCVQMKKQQLEPDIQECAVRWALGTLLQMKLVEVLEFQPSDFKS